MADKLHFSLVSPERQLFSGDVDQVIVPGSEGDFGVLPEHAPFMATLRMGALNIDEGSKTTRIFVRGGFADVTPDGLTVLAEEAVDLSQVNKDTLAGELKDAREDVGLAGSDEARREAAMAQLAYLEALQASL